jgi:hypothetical protein
MHRLIFRDFSSVLRSPPAVTSRTDEHKKRLCTIEKRTKQIISSTKKRAGGNDPRKRRQCGARQKRTGGNDPCQRIVVLIF